MIISYEDANNISFNWIHLWNERLFDKYMAQYDEEAILVSNVALRMFPESNGRLSGKTLLTNYWSLVMKKFPQFKFKRNKFETYENKIIVYYESIIDETKAIAILTINGNLLITKIEVSYV